MLEKRATLLHASLANIEYEYIHIKRTKSLCMISFFGLSLPIFLQLLQHVFVCCYVRVYLLNSVIREFLKRF